MRTQRGFTFIGLLMIVVIMGLMLTVVSRVWTTTEQRERETQLLFVGHEFRTAIASYYAAGHRYPATLEDLLTDERFPVPKRHLRRLYVDPMTGRTDWTLVPTPDGQGIMGVASSSTGAPLKRDGFDFSDENFKDTDCYCAWQFIYWGRGARWGNVPATAPTSPGATSASPTGDSPNFGPAAPGFSPGNLSPLPPNGSLIAPRVAQPQAIDAN